ncbi:MAG: Glycosyl transferase, group 1 [Candidatus Amesbacteria bacterium GW2011_GWA1_47_16]|uniref:Glycosyl transferase family 1 domain-containing protein n=5 Tax=Candidatus Amesiibacteriota TaxID=1752730 RepID=A0A1F4ZWQ1_9BACT|nr:MAG: Glycosyl transferase group 1 [Candidatus Amesbacteria bacterium GW2011_GWC1_47_15]KKU65116.1 MAG: Glycosyl transferase, group 1 [Candidatus Amesbacteria bacterium GW2011_GWA1_47_16]KKU97744.1 MAG: Glycosyl transferase, group 1 [Candidatus Amesbacteria bacterium GW2011_GWB1_48_13]OGC99811.1 MAG: hypothetical protein A2701_03455 [Candidatus Amesbacteria bacterium RIFCSPHIGHO2_01_FULL_47_34]OGD01227.1 MAG: hypothetical protein A2972_01460 [Candidatus Amesbacteria bacterium RIFCSPLOWO2_01_F
MGNLPERIALVYDRVNKWGGAEQVLLALHELFPKAPLFTSVYHPAKAAWAQVFPEVITSFLQKFPFAKSHHEIYPWLTPLAFETLELNNFDAVISVTSADAKGIITRPDTFHLCYCLTPTRYLWSHYDFHKKLLNPVNRWFSQPVFEYMKYWDLIASRRPDEYISISKTVQNRVKRYYGLDSQVIYPPVDIDVFSTPAPPPSIKDFFLYVSRLVAYKRPDVVINVFNEINLPLVVIGTGSLEKKLRRIARPHITILGNVSREVLVSHYQHSRALIFFHEEDFGIVPVEAQAAGTPVIALNKGGASETVIHGKTGILIEDNSPASLRHALAGFSKESFSSSFIQSHADRFSKERFKSEFVKLFTLRWKKYKSIHMS